MSEREKLKEAARRIVGALPWGPLAVILSAVTLGVSQIAFNMILMNRDWFPSGGAFALWVLLWFLAAPVALLLGVDRLIGRRGEDRGTFRSWRAGLYAFVAVSLLRQAEVYYGGERFEGWRGMALYGGTAAGVALLAVRSSRAMQQYLTILSLLAVYLSTSFVWRSVDAGSSPAAGAPSATRRSAPGAGPPVYILIADEFSQDLLIREGRFDREQFPRLSALADDSVWIPRARANFGMTSDALPSMLTGSLVPDRGTTLFERLSADYEIRVIETAPPIELWMTRRRLEASVSLLSGKRRILSRDPLLAGVYVLQNLAQTAFLRAGGRTQLDQSPAFHATFEREHDLFFEQAVRPGTLSFWHCSIPHAPFVYDADGTRHGRPFVSFDPDPTDDRERALILANYREQARLLDAIVGRLVDRLKKVGLYERSVILVTSDHGLRNWGSRLRDSFDQTVGVPFILHAPGRKAGRLEVEYQHIDLVPTLLEAMGARFDPSDFDGISAFASNRKSRAFVFDFMGLKYVRDGRGIWSPLRH